ncbi:MULTISPECIES: hypothetical protein [Streptomyces]|uniref:hypothetical protein n=1 Tax=Streptomyces TaxID=1883 RepID=UPI001C2FDA85|nr:hypothetical protein [Streptomyces sp. GbtcB7]
MPGTNSSDLSELDATRKHIAELEAELAIHRRAAELLGEVTSPKGGSIEGAVGLRDAGGLVLAAVDAVHA